MAIDTDQAGNQLQFSGLARLDWVGHGITTRRDGCSRGSFAERNLGFHVGDEPQRVMKNRQLTFAGPDFSLEAIVVGQQVHSNRVALVTPMDAGRGALGHDSAIPGVDALITNHIGICLCVLVADCSPIILVDPVNRAVAILHAGRVGTLNGVLDTTINGMKDAFGTEPNAIVAAIGPAISADNYIISEAKIPDLVSKMDSRATSLVQYPDGTYHFDLIGYQLESLLRLGVRNENVELANICTFDRSDLFFSERRDGAPTGRFAAYVMML